MPEHNDPIHFTDFIDAEFVDIVPNTAITRVPDPRLFENVENRCPCVLLLDTSASMYGQPLNELNLGIKRFKEELMQDSNAPKRVEVAIVTFGGSVRLISEFQTVDDFQPPTLTSEGDTPMGEAIEKSIEMIIRRKAQIRSQGVGLYRPWIFLITDGEPTDGNKWEKAAELVRRGETSKSFCFFPVGVSGYNQNVLAQISVRETVRLINPTKFSDMFKWLSDSLASVSRSRPGERVELANAPGSTWGIID